MIAETVRMHIASAPIPGMINVEVVITRIVTGPAETYRVQLVSPTRVGDVWFWETEQEARTCANAAWTVGRDLARDHGITTLAHDASKPRTDVPQVSAPAPVKPVSDVPAGRYALDRDGVIKFYIVDHGRKGTRWDGYTFVSVQASDDKYPVRNHAERKAILALIAEDPRGAMMRYGRELGSCGMCGRTLTSEWRHQGIGPECSKK